ncbi:hypothetical protein JCM30760_26040 [Thiomicrorhabdus hydrogeniphila]
MIDNSKGLIEINKGILEHIRYVSGKTSRFSASVKLGISTVMVDEVCGLDPYQVNEKAIKFAERGLVINMNNLDNKTNGLGSSLSIDSFFKASI